MERTEPQENSSGFALLFVLVLLLVLTVSGFLIAGSTRIDTQIVNTIRNERVAFYAAEAGLAEAYQRLGLVSGATASPSGIGTFDATFKGPYAPDSANPDWNAKIVFTSAGTYPSKVDANTVITPSIQDSGSRLNYSTSTIDGAGNLLIQWSKCTAVDASRGCDAIDTIRTIGGKKVLQIVSTGRSGAARRQLLLDLHLGDATSAVVLRSDICPGVSAEGSGTIEFPGGITVNSECSSAINTQGAAGIKAGGPIEVVGGWDEGDKISPAPTSAPSPADDPLFELPIPTSTDVRNGSAESPETRVVKSSPPVTLEPGIYYGGIEVQANGELTLNPGNYILAGGGFTVAANATVSGSGVMLYNTCTVEDGACMTDAPGAYGAINITAKNPVNLSAPTSGPWEGIVIFQDRLNPATLSFTSNANGSIDGLIYAKIAQIFMQGESELLNSQLVVGSILLKGGPVIGAPTDWLDLGGTGGTATAVAWSDR